jgi:hypothetical protein
VSRETGNSFILKNSEIATLFSFKFEGGICIPKQGNESTEGEDRITILRSSTWKSLQKKGRSCFRKRSVEVSLY